MYYKYPYTDFHELNLDYILKLVRESIGLGLKVTDKQLQLVNDLGEVVSAVTVSFATAAQKDEEGRNLTAYLIDAGVNGRSLVLKKGDGSTVSLTIPYAEKASQDENGVALTSYLKNVQVSGNQLTITLGDGSTYNLTVPFATHSSTADEASHSAEADHAEEADVAEKANKDSAGNAIRSTYAVRLTVQNDQLKLEAADGTQLSLITVPFATLAENANKALESVVISGNQLIFTTHENAQTSITVPYALKAVNDVDGDAIVENYVANVQNNAATGEITFYAKDGSVLAQLTPTVDSAVHDSYGNVIADYIKNVVATAGSDYVVFTKGTGDTVSIKVDYSNRAWKDTNNNIISNTYVAFANFVKDSVTNEPWMVFYNGETAELFRTQIEAISAMKDGSGNVITGTYGSTLAVSGKNLQLKAPDGTILATVQMPGADLSGLVLMDSPSGYGIALYDTATLLSAIVPRLATCAINDRPIAQYYLTASEEFARIFRVVDYVRTGRVLTEENEYSYDDFYSNLLLKNGLGYDAETIPLYNLQPNVKEYTVQLQFQEWTNSKVNNVDTWFTDILPDVITTQRSVVEIIPDNTVVVGSDGETVDPSNIKLFEYFKPVFLTATDKTTDPTYWKGLRVCTIADPLGPDQDAPIFSFKVRVINYGFAGQ